MLLNFPGHLKLLMIGHNPDWLMTSQIPVSSKTKQCSSGYCGWLLYGRGDSHGFLSQVQVTTYFFFKSCWITLFNNLCGIPLRQLQLILNVFRVISYIMPPSPAPQFGLLWHFMSVSYVKKGLIQMSKNLSSFYWKVVEDIYMYWWCVYAHTLIHTTRTHTPSRNFQFFVF